MFESGNIKIQKIMRGHDAGYYIVSKNIIFSLSHVTNTRGNIYLNCS